MPSSSLYRLIDRKRFTLDVFRGLIAKRAEIILELFRSHTPPANLAQYGLFWCPERSATAVPISAMHGTNWLSNIGPSDEAQKLFSSLRGVIGPLDHNWMFWPSLPPTDRTRRYWIFSDDGTWLRLYVVVNDPDWQVRKGETWVTIRIDALPIEEAITSFADGQRVWDALGHTAQTFLERAKSRAARTLEAVTVMNEADWIIKTLLSRKP